MDELEIASLRVPVRYRDDACTARRRRRLGYTEWKKADSCVLAGGLDGRGGSGLQRPERLEFPIRIRGEKHDPAGIHDERYIVTAAPRCFDIVEAHLDHGNADHVAMIADHLRIIKA